MTDYLISSLLGATFALFILAIPAGTISKKIAYYLGAMGSASGIALSLVVLVSNSTLSIGLWNITSSSSAQILISPFSAYFLLISCTVWLGTCIFSLGYDDDYPRSLSSLLILTMLSMTLILVAGDAILFLVGWESMTIASFFMILEGKGIRKGVINAAFLFLAFGEGSSIFIMLAFAGIFSSYHSLDFLGATSVIAIGPIASWVFLSALIGFGLKMGIAPFHMSEWLPIAHSSAPSNVSALLSATLTLMGVYGLIVVVTHLGPYELWWGWVALVIGGISAMLGAIFASVSEHTKGLPAYSTIENNGLIVVAIGAYILASYYNLTLMADLALIAALYHSFSHSISKASMFLLMGWISKIKGSFDLNKVGSSASDKTRTIYFPGLFTVLSLAAVPPLAGFVSEWMILEVLFQSFRFGDVGSQIIGTLVGAVAALAAGIIIVAMTKAYGFGILWSKGGTSLASSSGTLDIPGSRGIRRSFVYFMALIIGVGVAAPAIFFLASRASTVILHGSVFNTFVTGLLGVPAYFVILSGAPFGGFSPTFTAIFMVGLLIVPILISQIGGRWRIRKTPGWFAGLATPNDSLELYNSFGYSTPIRIMLKFLFRTKEKIVYVGEARKAVMLFPEEYFVELEVVDVFKGVYDWVGKRAIAISEFFARKFMPGRLSYYIVYIMAALVFVILYVLFTIHAG
ncbi:MAG: proton-conducting transporter transmembrane domain-containing protein [Nitrososphaerales archaeon]